MSTHRNRYPERDNRSQKQEAMSQLARRNAEQRAEQQSAAANEATKTARLRAMRLAKEAADRRDAGAPAVSAPVADEAPSKRSLKRPAAPGRSAAKAEAR